MIVRYFVYDDDPDNDGKAEVDEAAFLESDLPIYYERHTMWANGVDQICLSKMPKGD